MALELNVDLGERSYPIQIGRGFLADGFDFSPYLAGSQCLIVTNETVAPLYADRLQECLADYRVRTVELPDGEAFKTMDTLRLVIDALVYMGAHRDATVIALGGGVVGDIAGFAAASYMRGIPFIQLPTTLLSQVDSSVGGKTGINHEGGKNLIGAFHQPRLVLIDTDTLKTLPTRELSAGMAEVIKHAAIADRGYFDWLEQHMAALLELDAVTMAKAIYRSCEIKSAVVAEDEREHGVRALLNFGHTFGHAIENSLGYGSWLHGEAVAAGMQMAAALSDIKDAERLRLADLCRAAALPVAPPPVGAEALRRAMSLDKKIAADAMRFVLLRSLGEAYVTSDYDQTRLDEILALADGGS